MLVCSLGRGTEADPPELLVGRADRDERARGSGPLHLTVVAESSLSPSLSQSQTEAPRKSRKSWKSGESD